MFRIFASKFTNVNLLFNPLNQFIMGKVVGLIGSASGKIGNLVYAVTNGIQTARVYQPIVSNPKSALQTMQRSKGNLAGRISGFTPRTAIMGLGTNNRARRGEFLRNILKKAMVVTTASGYEAKIDNPDILFSRGSVNLSIASGTVTALNNSMSVTLTGVASGTISPEVYASMQTRLVAMVYDSTSQELIEVVTSIAVKPAIGGTAATLLAVSNSGGYYVDVYAIPMSTADGSAITISSGLALKDDDAIAAALSVNANSVVFNYGKSSLIATGQFTPAP